MGRTRQEQGGIDLRKLPDIVIRKLGREDSHGLASHPMFSEITPLTHPLVEIDRATKGLKRLEIAIHESMHVAIPALPESIVRYSSRYIAKVVWRLGYRADEEWQNEEFTSRKE